MMKRYTPYVIFCLASLIAAVALFGNDSYSELQSLKMSLKTQVKKTTGLRQDIAKLRKKVHGIQMDDRTLEKTARDHLALARENEVVFLFDGAGKKE